ncbi:MAG TPA: class I SAM-dependent methyltransferase [Labilithrix sp.]|jgi:23S rRNA (cytosine1962-C5)-methyltransferase
MDRRAVWPDFRAEDVLFEDADLLVVRKRAGIPSQAAQPDRPDDLVTRLRARLGGAYLGVHQRLDRDTSGVVLFTKRKEANAHVAKQFEGREAKKRYLAAVTGWTRREATLVDELRPSDDGRMEVVRRGGKRAVTHVKLLRRNGDRALLELVLETGRTHQARVQLAHAGAPIAGDPLYGGAAAARLMLHASSLAIEHPRTRRTKTFVDDRAEALEQWLERGALHERVYDDPAALDAALALALERRWGFGRSGDRDPEDRRTTTFRLVNEDGDALPGLAVDVYDAWLVAQLHAGDMWTEARRSLVLDRLAALGFDGVYLKLRPKQANVLVETRRDDVAPRSAVRGESAPAEIVVHEEGVPYRVRLGDGLSTGLFLDQRQNRRLVRSLASRSRVANLFAYTCGFSVAAAVGGAARTVSVDASPAALERGRENLIGAGAAIENHSFAAEDAFAWLARAAKKGERFDLVVLDPPSYSSTKKRRFVAESDYGELVAEALAVVAPGGKILACCNHRGMSRARLRRLASEGAREAKREVAQLKDLPSGADFPPEPGRDVHMKSVLLTVKG